MTEEIWKSIPGYEGIYEASNLGRIRTALGKTTRNARFNSRTWKQRVLKQKINGSKRKDARVDLWKNGTRKTHLVARLVASAFIPVFNENMTVNHIDGNHLNNNASNLEWCSIEDNLHHAFRTGLMDSFCKSVILSDGENTYPFKSMSNASVWLGRNKGYMANCARNNRRITSADGKIYEVL